MSNFAGGSWATIGGGQNNLAGGVYTTVGGGYLNRTNAMTATIGGGEYVTVTGKAATVAGGSWITVTADYAAAGGGWRNTASGYAATVAGGQHNIASGSRAAIGGGQDNTASGSYASVPGGRGAVAQGDYSFAAGRRAKAYNQSCFVWGDATPAEVTCNSDNRWVARASGGVYFYTNSDLTSGFYVPAGGNAWSSVSDRALKENVTPVDGQEVLARLADVPIAAWNYKSQDPSVRHIGPMAQDFSAAFGVGEDDKHISTVDADGVALAAIQGLYQLAQDQKAEIAALKAENAAQQGQIAALQQQNATIEARLSALEQQMGGSRLSLAQLPGGWLLLGGLLVAAAVAGRRWYAGGGR